MEVKSILLCSVSLLFLIWIGGGSTDPVLRRRMLDTILDTNKYDRRIRPFGNDTTAPTNVTVNLYLRSIQKVDEINMNFQTQLTFRMEWVDPRLGFATLLSDKERKGVSYLTLTGSDRPIWIPDLFFSNEIKAHTHDLLLPNTYTRIFPNGQVLHSLRLSLTLSCPMLLKTFPFDSQTCSIRMASYAYTKDDLIFKWKHVDPVQITPHLDLPKFTLRQFSTDYCDSLTATGIYRCLRLDMLFVRNFSHYMIQIYIPLVMFVIVSYLGLWIDRKYMVGRLLVSLLTLLVTSLTTIHINSTLPIVSYSKAIDVWTGTTLTFVFSAFLISILSNHFGEKEPATGESNPRGEIEEIELEPLWKKIGGSGFMEKYKGKSVWNKIECVVLGLFPLGFLLFLIIYFATYSAKQPWEHPVNNWGDNDVDYPGRVVVRQPV